MKLFVYKSTGFDMEKFISFQVTRTGKIAISLLGVTQALWIDETEAKGFLAALGRATGSNVEETKEKSDANKEVQRAIRASRPNESERTPITELLDDDAPF